MPASFHVRRPCDGVLPSIRQTLAAAQEAGAATLNYGVFITAILNFLIMAFVIFFIVKAINKARDAASKKEEEAAEEAPAGPTSEELLGQILEEIKAQK